MEKIEYPCPCGGHIKWKKERIIQEGVDCGILDVEICEKCGSKYFPEESMSIVENKLKENNLWGIKRKEIKFWKSGSSVVVRFPKEIAKSLNLSNIKIGHVYAEGKNKIAIDF